MLLRSALLPPARALSSAAVPPPVLRVAIAGGGIAGCILASQLLKEPRVEVRVFEQRQRDALPPGLNLLLNHNGMSALRAVDPILEEAVRGRGHDIVGWSARKMTGHVLYDIPDAVAAGLADCNGVRARWDEVNAEVQRACWDAIEWGDAVTGYRYVTDDDGRMSVAAEFGDGSRSDVEADLLVATDGRYSAVRRFLEGGELPPPRFGPPAIADFRVVARESDELAPMLQGVVDDMLRVYNVPDLSLVAPGGRYAHLAADEAFMTDCMRGVARVGVMKIRPPPETGALRSSTYDHGELGHIGIWGNFRLPAGGAPIPPAAKTRDGLAALFTPAEGEGAMDPVGRLVHAMLTEHTERLHWTRKQETAQRMVDGPGHVLLLGDASGAIFPSLGQGANLAIEDACAAATALRTFVRSALESGFEQIDVPAATLAIEQMRLQRRCAVQSLSREHARHVFAEAGGERALAMETADWTGETGGRFPRGAWRAQLTRLWRGYPAQEDVAAAAAAAAKLTNDARFDTEADAAETSACGAPIMAQTATPANFAAFGQVLKPEEDGLLYDKELDAQLDGLANGTPRLYLMRLEGPRPLTIDRITQHKMVSQCLGALGTTSKDADFYLAVHEPTRDGEAPALERVKAFLIPPGTFVKLHRGTWHAGPLWTGADATRTFYNLELSDTNVVDHHTVYLTPTKIVAASL